MSVEKIKLLRHEFTLPARSLLSIVTEHFSATCMLASSNSAVLLCAIPHTQRSAQLLRRRRLERRLSTPTAVLMFCCCCCRWPAAACDIPITGGSSARIERITSLPVGRREEPKATGWSFRERVVASSLCLGSPGASAVRCVVPSYSTTKRICGWIDDMICSEFIWFRLRRRAMSS